MLARFLALVLPALIGVAAARWLSVPEPRALSPFARGMDAELADLQPSVVIVGNSKAMQDIDGKALAEALGVKGHLAQLVVTGSAAPAWYTMLEQRVFGAGYRPELVIVYGQFGAMLRDDVLSDTERQLIEGLTDKPSPMLDERVFGHASGGVGLAHERGFREHEAFVARLREAGASLLGEGGGNHAWEAVFGADAGVRTSGNTRMVPGEDPAAPRGAMAAGAAGTGFVDGMLALGNEAGARMLFVRAPVAAQVQARDEVPAAVEAALYAHLNAAGASWIDLHELALPSGAFRDDYHLVKGGADVLTAALAERMVAGNVLGGGVLTAGPPFRARSVVRVGTATTWSFDAPPPGATATVSIVVRTVGVGGGSLEVDGASPAKVPLVAAGRVLRATLAVPATGAWTATLRPDSGAELTVHQLVVTGAEPHLVVGSPWAETHLLQARPTFSVEPTVLGPYSSVDEGGGVQRFEVPALAALADDIVNERTGKPCSPIEVSNDPADFPKTVHVGPKQLVRHEGVSSEGAVVRVRRTGVGSTWWARLNPERSCVRGTRYFPGWLYSGDVATLTLLGKRLAAHPLGIDRLLLRAASFGGDTTLGITVNRRAHGGFEPEWQGSIIVPEADGLTSRELVIEPPLAVEGNRQVELRIEGGSLLVYDASLVESESLAP